MKITSEKALRTLYKLPTGRAKDKVLTQLETHSRHFITQAPFLILSTVDHTGKMDASPRGGAPGFVHILTDTTLLIPDAKGNNRLDSLTNIISTGHIGMLFLIPGIDETLRINGEASIRTDPSFLKKFTQLRHPPASAIVVEISEVFLHCAKALMRSKLWDVQQQIDHESFPTMGQMLKDQLGSPEPPENQSDMLQRYRKDL